MAHKYNAPPADPSTIGDQVINQFHIKKSLTELAKETYFGQLADVVNMPKHYGKKISVFLYVPMLDDRNVNDQGIDAAGVVIDKSRFSVAIPYETETYTVEADATAAAAAANAIKAGSAVKSGTATPWTVTFSETLFENATQVQAEALRTAVPGSRVRQNSGNMYGSSKDIGTINGKLPMLGEEGGRVNRVGYTRVLREGELHKMGFFQEITQDAMDFDNDPQLAQHLSDEQLKGANELTEDVLQIDLLTQAGVVAYPGVYVSDASMTAEPAGQAAAAVVSYADLDRLSQVLTDNRVPKQTKIITGSRMIDTRTISGGWVMLAGSELLPTFRAMKDPHGNPAWIPVHQYAAGGTVLNGEAGSVGDFRIVIVPEMLHWAGVGAKVGTNPGYRATSGRYDVFPMLVVGAESFSAIGFQTDGARVKFKTITKLPGRETADHRDPYGETGFSSMRWFYGTLVQRPERLALLKSLARI